MRLAAGFSAWILLTAIPVAANSQTSGYVDRGSAGAYTPGYFDHGSAGAYTPGYFDRGSAGAYTPGYNH